MRRPPPFPTPEPAVLAEPTWDVAVVGAGPAGAMTAYALAEEGCRVVLLDRRDFPRWKVCGACLSPGAQAVLARFGLDKLPGELGAMPLNVLRLGGWSRRADLPLRGSLALSRRALDAALVASARGRGVTFSHRTKAHLESVTSQFARLRVELPGTSVKVTARIVVAADGLHSLTLAKAIGTKSAIPSASSGKIGLGAVFNDTEAAYGPGVIHMAVGEEGYVGLVRTEDDHLNVAAALKSSAVGRGRSPGEAVAELLRQAAFPPLPKHTVEGWKGTPRMTYHTPRLGGQRVFAVGDAAGYVEPFTGEGMSWALSGAGVLAPIVRRAVVGWTENHLKEWEWNYRQTIGRSQRLCRGAAWTLARPRLSRSTLRLLGRFPQIALPFVRRAASPPSFIPRREM